MPLLTRGSFALLFGGERIIDKLSPGSPGYQDPFTTFVNVIVLCRKILSNLSVEMDVSHFNPHQTMASTS